MIDVVNSIDHAIARAHRDGAMVVRIWLTTDDCEHLERQVSRHMMMRTSAIANTFRGIPISTTMAAQERSRVIDDTGRAHYLIG